MKKWTNPNIYTLGVQATKGNPSTNGNDAAIPDCIENALESIFGDHSGPCKPNKPSNPDILS